MSLVSLEEVKGFLQARPDTEDEEVLEMLIGAVTRSFRNHTHREFEPTDDDTRRFAHFGGNYLNISPYDLRAVDEVKVGVDSENASTLSQGDYTLRPLPARDGVFQWIKLSVDPGECEIEAKGDWGFAEVPDDIKHLALTQIALWLRRDIQTFERTFNIDAGFFERPEALSSAVRGGLADFKRIVLP